MRKQSSILIAEDEDINYQYLLALVQGYAGEITRARTGTEAIEICKVKSIDLVLMDIGMPVLDGLQATTEIKKHKPNLPILAQTAFCMPDEIERIYAAGCDAIIVKPIRKDVFSDTIEKYI